MADTKSPRRVKKSEKPIPQPELAPSAAEARPQATSSPVPPPKTIYVSFSAEVTTQTTEALLGVMAQQVMQGMQHVYLLLSTPGGQVTCGINIYNVLRAMPFHLTTHNVGNVDSIGNVVFLAGAERYACPHSTFMFHGVGFDIQQAVRFEEKLLRERCRGS
jgi:ATP-dependent Clp protease, protease subunit